MDSHEGVVLRLLPYFYNYSYSSLMKAPVFAVQRSEENADNSLTQLPCTIGTRQPINYH